VQACGSAQQEEAVAEGKGVRNREAKQNPDFCSMQWWREETVLPGKRSAQVYSACSAERQWQARGRWCA